MNAPREISRRRNWVAYRPPLSFPQAFLDTSPSPRVWYNVEIIGSRASS